MGVDDVLCPQVVGRCRIAKVMYRAVNYSRSHISTYSSDGIRCNGILEPVLGQVLTFSRSRYTRHL